MDAMIKTIAHVRRAALTAAFIFAGSTFVFGQRPSSPTDCRPPEVNPRAPAYKVAHSVHTSNSPPETVVTVSVDPRHFVRDDMRTLARQLNKDFCHEPRLSVMILDDEMVARNTSPLGGGYGLFKLRWRGTYFIDRTTREEYIEFSTRPRRPDDEVRINLGPPKRARRRVLPARH